MSQLRIEALTQGEIESIHRNTLAVLETTGVRVQDDICRQKLAQAGARIDQERAYLPAAMVEDYLAQAPKSYTIYSVDGRPITVGGSARIYGSLVTDPWVIDYETQCPRRPRLEDIERHTRLGDAHPQISLIHRMDMPPEDLPAETAYIRSLETFVTNTTKHLMSLPSSDESTQDWLEVAQILAGGRRLGEKPFMSFGIAVTSPLTFTGINARVLHEAVRHGLPIIPVVCPIAGTTSPLSFAGTLLIANCECLFLITLAQVLRPGATICYGAGPSVMDLRTGHDIYYNADKMLWKVANSQMGQHYVLPITGETGGSMVGRYDIQAGIEAATLMLPALACGQNIMNGLGSNYNACGMSAEMIVIQADMAQLMERLSAGIDAGAERQDVESIQRVGPGGHFLEEPLTIKMLRSGEFFFSGCFDRLGERSPNAPEDSMLVRAHERVEELLRSHVPAVSDRVREEIRRWARNREAGKRAY